MWSLLIFRRLGLPMLQFFFPASLFWESAPKQTKYVALRREGKKDKLGGAIRNEEEEFIVVIMASELSLFFLVWEISVRFYTKFPPHPLSRMCMGISGVFYAIVIYDLERLFPLFSPRNPPFAAAFSDTHDECQRRSRNIPASHISKCRNKNRTFPPPPKKRYVCQFSHHRRFFFWNS